MLIAATSDIHGRLPPLDHVPEADYLVIAGDFLPDCPQWAGFTDQARRFYSEYQAEWLLDKGIPWLDAVRQKIGFIIMTPGNHDFLFEGAYPDMPVIMLIDSFVSIEGVLFYGTPWVKGDDLQEWAYCKNEANGDLAKVWEPIYSGTDVLITHDPMWGHGDRIYWEGAYKYVGSRSLLDKARKVKPKLHICGHIHEGRGSYPVSTNDLTRDILFYSHNVSWCDERYEPNGSIPTFRVGESEWGVDSL